MKETNRRDNALSIEKLSHLREKTESFSQFFGDMLKSHLDTLRPLFAPRRLLGRHAGAKEDVTGSDRALALLQEKYRAVCRHPYGLSSELPEDFLDHLDNRPDMYAWEYAYVAKSKHESKSLTITSPVRWILTYRSDYTFAQLRQALAEKGERRAQSVRQFVINALVMHLFLKAFPSLTQLLLDLRYKIDSEPLLGLGELPFVTIRSCLPSLRPPDELLLAATRFSGVPAFIELIDLDSALTLQDPLKLRIEQILSSSA